MFTISQCPKCVAQVLLPEGVPAEAVVRCPLCQEEYPLSDALAALPPMLIVVDPALLLVNQAETAGLAATTEEAAVAIGDELSPQTAEGEAAQFGGHFDEIGFDEELAVADSDEDGDDESGEIAIREDEESIDGAAFGMAAPVGTAEGITPTEGEAQPKRRRRYKSNPIRNLIGLVGSGVVGLMLGYYVLNFFCGEQCDYLKIWLPGVPHTAKHWSSDKAAEKPAAKPAVNGQKNGKAAKGKGDQPQPPANQGALEMGPMTGGGDEKVEPEDPSTTMVDPVIPTIDPPAIPDLPAAPQIQPPTPDVTVSGATETPETTVTTPETPETTVETTPKQSEVAVTDPTPSTQENVPETKNGTETTASEPKSPETTPPSDPQPPTAAPSKAGLKNAPVYTADDLAESIKAVYEVFGCLPCNSTGQVTQDGQASPCPACKGQPNREITPEVYARLCRVADAATFVQGAAQLPVDQQKAAAETLFAHLAAAKTGEAIAKLASTQMADSNAVAGGIVLPCTAGNSSSQNGLFGLVIEVVGGAKTVALSDHALPVKTGEQVFILGRMVKNPAENVSGYAGKKPLVIWGGMAVKLASP